MAEWGTKEWFDEAATRKHEHGDSSFTLGYKAGYREGMINGMTLFAWWKDGVQYVGTCGTRLKDAINKFLEEDK